MKKLNRTVALFSIFSLGFIAAFAYAEGAAANRFATREVSKLLWSNVETPQGEYLGRIKDFAVDSEGRIQFAILLEGFPETGESRLIAVPYAALSLGAAGDHFVLDTSREKLASAPTFDESEDLLSRKFAEDVYRYFGQQPYWTEEDDPAGSPIPASPTLDQG